MYNWEKPMTEHRRKQNPPNLPLSSSIPSFSSSLLDEIYKSIDDRDKIAKKQSNGGVRKSKSSSIVDDEETASLRRVRLAEKWLQNREFDRLSQLHQRGVSESDTESMSKSRRSCFAPMMPKPPPVRTRASVIGKSEKMGKVSSPCDRHHQQHHHHRRSNEELKHEDGLAKSKFRASTIYSHLKKMRQPISPGGKLTSLINSLFSNGISKKTKNYCSSMGEYDDEFAERKVNSTQTCSLASSYSRSCLTKTRLENEKLNKGEKKKVRFYPVSVIVDENCHPCGHKSIYEDNSGNFGSRKEISVEDEEDDVGSDSSSDLFELDHLALGVNNVRYSEELPVYETTYRPRNHAKASGLTL